MFNDPMDSYIYSAWFFNEEASDGDQDREWVACIGIQAATGVEAQEWGDTLAQERTRRLPDDRFVRSFVELESEATGVSDWSSLPRIVAGEAATDAIIGW